MHMYTVKYYSAMRKKELLLFEATWMNLEGIMFGEITQKNKYQVLVTFGT